jgi:hypothetical protein
VIVPAACSRRRPGARDGARGRKRTIVYMTPCRDHFLASFARGEKACRAAHAAGLAASLLAAIDGAPTYAEGRGVRIPVRNGRDLQDVESLAAMKMAN